MAVSEERIRYWMERLPPNTPEENRVLNYYRDRWAQQAALEDAMAQEGTPKAGEGARSTEEPDGSE